VTIVSTKAALTRAERVSILSLSAERDTWLRRELAAERRGFDRGRAAGWRQGRESAHAEMAAAWRPVAERVRSLAGSPTWAELEARRWGPAGREHYGDPRPGDYCGGPVAWEPAGSEVAA
jgi:hypothetical protein